MKKSKKLAIGLVFVALATAGAYDIYVNSGSPEARELNSALKSGKPVLLYFHSAGCVACVEQEAILDAMESEHGSKLIIVRVDFAENQELFKEYAGLVSAFPVIVAFDSDGRKIKGYSGLTQRDVLEDALVLG